MTDTDRAAVLHRSLNLRLLLAVAAIVFPLAAGMYGINNRITDLNNRIDDTNNRINDTNNRIDETNSRMQAGFADLSRRIDTLAAGQAEIRERLARMETHQDPPSPTPPAN